MQSVHGADPPVHLATYYRSDLRLTLDALVNVSIMSTIPSANTNLPTLMLAEKIAAEDPH